MKIIQKIHKFFADKDYQDYVILKLAAKYLISDKLYLKYLFKKRMGYNLNLKNPKTFNEKLQWLKLYDRNPEYTKMVDKIQAKEYVASIIGPEHIISTLGIWDDPSKINYDELPEQFVIKCNHNSGTGMYICKDKSKMDINAVNEGLRKGLNENFYKYGREWPYKNITRKIICEEYITDMPNSNNLTDYKFFCFNGKVDCVMLCLERNSGNTKFYFFDKDWSLKRINIRGKNAPKDFTIKKPSCMDEMFEIAAKLSKGLPFVRVDLYQSNDFVFFGELTFFPDCGFDSNLLPETDDYFGSLINI